MTLYILERLVQLSICGTALTAVLLLIKPITKKVFSPKWHYLTYVLALLVFLVPLSVKFTRKEPAMNMESTAKNNAVVSYTLPISENTDDESQNGAEMPDKANVDVSKYAPMVLAVWLCTGGLIFCFSAVSYAVFVIKNRTANKLDRKDILSKYGCEKLCVVVSDRVKSPMLLGFLKCTLYLPNTNCSEKDLQNILCHECVHMKRRDCLVKWLCLVVKSLHFFNPVVHVLCKNINEWCEISCDIFATRDFNEKERKSYCETILSLVTKKNNSGALVMGIGGTKKQLERRFMAVMKNKTIGRKTAVISGILAGLAILSALTVSALLGGEVKKEYDENKESGSKLAAVEAYANETVSADASDVSVIGGADGPAAVLVKSTEKSNSDFDGIYEAGDKSGNIINLILYDAIDGEIEYIEPVDVNGKDIYVSCGIIPERHNGIDYAAPLGIPVKASVSGEVITAQYDYKYGNHVIISGERCNVTLAHLESMSVKVGDYVNAGDIIGTVGSTGMSVGPHVHLEFNAK